MSTLAPPPAGWKTYDEFAAGIATNRLPASDGLVGQTLRIDFPARTLALHFDRPNEVAWEDSAQGEGRDWCETVEVAPHTFFIDITFKARPLAALTVIANTRTRRVLAIESRVRSAEEAGAEPRVAQDFLAGSLGGGTASGVVPHESRDLIGLRTWQTYSPNHTYEHTYLSSQRYCWQCLVGVQRGHGDVDMATYYKFDEQQYIFTFREFLIPVASVFFFNFESKRSTGKFLGLTGDGAIANNPAGAFMEKASTTLYPASHNPI
ncbi:MAG TPA: MoaF C-terminal domain-containing protein [Burkholderiaceae bacterium]|nr:MoaF C-terminal domain-containing protein [Burkholderiaceae bacterium]